MQWAQKGLISLVCASKMVRDHFWKNTFLAHFLTHFWSQNSPFSKAFCDFGWAKMACNGLKMGSFHLFRHPKWSRIIFGTHIFDPFWTHFLSQNSPFSRHFGIFGGPKQASTSSKRAKNTCFGILCGRRIIFGKTLELHPVDSVHAFWHPPLWATSCSLPQPIGPRYVGLGVG